MTLSSLCFVVFLDPYQGSNGVCLLSKYVVFLIWGIVALPSLSPYSNKVLIFGAHRWLTANTYLKDIYCIVKPWIQKHKPISQIKMCMCGEWMVIMVKIMVKVWFFFCSFEGVHIFLALEAFEGNEMLYILFFFSLRWVSCTPNSIVGHLSILTSCLTFSLFFFLEVSGTCPFLFPRIHFFF